MCKKHRGGNILNQKLQKVTREIERAKAKIAELQAALPLLEKQKTELENAEIIKVFRSANVTPDDITAFVEKVKSNTADGELRQEQMLPSINLSEDIKNDEE